MGEDIRRQLPRESAEFDDVNGNWKRITVQLFKTKNALRGTHEKSKCITLEFVNFARNKNVCFIIYTVLKLIFYIADLLETLTDMNSKLEEIQKSLDMYLETKRQIFPRFYFLSNDDLLEILGQSRNPEAVQPHLKKCFDNIVKLAMTKVISSCF